MKKIILGIIVLTFLLLPQGLSAQTGTPLSKDTVNILLGRLNASTSRLERIASRISSRLEKIKSGGLETTNLDSQYASLVEQLSKLKSQLINTEKSATVSLENQNSQNEYLSFRNQAIDVRDMLEEVLSAEKNLVNDMKQYTAPTAIVPENTESSKE